MANNSSDEGDSAETAGQSAPRSWVTSIVWAAVLVGVSIVVSATVNPLFGRAVHWDWMAAVAPTAFVAVTVAFRRRWV